MSKKILIAISAMLTAGCFFGGESDTPTGIVQDVPKVKMITPGTYTGDYSFLPDSVRRGLESEFILDAAGTFRLFWVSENEAVYDQRGQWFQKDSALYLDTLTEAWVSFGVFDNFASIQKDTNAVAGVTDSSFARREWTPLQQRPLWITYKRKTFPVLREGSYVTNKSDFNFIDSSTTHYKITINLKNKVYFFSVLADTLETFQADAKYYQIGSFLVMDENRQREPDSTNTFPDWTTYQGSVFQRLQEVNDTSFTLWNPPASFLDSGSWVPYNKIATD